MQPQQRLVNQAKPQRGSAMGSPGSQLMLLGVLGAVTSAYGLWVDYQKRKQPGYRAMCESCSNVMSTKYGSLLQYHGLVSKGSMYDIPNTLLGMLAYSLFILYPVVRKVPYHQHFYTAASAVAVALSAYLAYILSFVLRDFCLVCVVSYFINIGLFWNSLKLLGVVNDDTFKRAATAAKKKTQ